MELHTHPLMVKLRSLQLPVSDFVVAGSGPLLAHGLREDVGDLDLVARGTAWKIALGLSDPVPTASGCGRRILLFDGAVEVFDQWLPGTNGPDELIDGAEFIDGIPFCPLQEVLAWKKRSTRDKDRMDIALITNFLQGS
ncbi:hypothetical protein [Streptomyces sp. NPDC006552]|uniref:hypothetical protein n=1 Tax=Streptomyces sp. NPDC006552 TaxID=3157179 RepID=UPI0033B6318D